MTARACVMVVEDNSLTRKVVRVALEKAGYRVLEAESGEVALHLLATHHPALILQDLHLPDMDGIALVRAFRATEGGESIPIFAFSGLLSKMEEARTLRAGFTDYIFKPIEPSRLLSMVETHLSPVIMHDTVEGLGARVLLVDDNVVQGKLNRRQLEGAGYLVDFVSNGRDALASARLKPPVAVVTDLLMSGMSGFELCLAIRRDPRLAALPVVVTTSSFAQIDEDDVALAARIGANAFVIRSPGFSEALAALAACVTQPRELMPVEHADRLQSEFLTRLIGQLEKQASLNASLARQAAMNSALLSIMSGASEIVMREQELPTLLQDVLARALDAGGVSAGAIFLFEPDGSLVLRSQIGFANRALKLVSDFYGHADFLRYLASGDRPVELPSEGVPDNLASQILATAGTRTLVIAPLLAGGASHGALLMRASSSELGQDFLTSVGAVAAQLGQAVALSRAMAAVKASELRYRSLYEGIPVGVFQTTVEGIVVDANTELARLLRYPTRDALLGLSASAHYVDPAARIRWREQLEQQAATTGTDKDHFEVQLRRHDGTVIWCAITAHLIRDNQGVATHYEGTISDVSARMEAEVALRETQHRLHQVMTYSDAMLYVLRVTEGAALEPEWTSANFARITGHSIEARLSRDWWEEQVHPDDRASVEEGLPDLLARGDRVVEYRLRRGDGGYTWMRDSQRVLRDHTGAPVEIVGVLLDINERKLLEAQLMQSQKMEAIGQLAAGVAHDFNNMLTAISGFAELLREELDPADQRREHIVEIVSAAHQAGTLTRQLLAFGRRQLLRPVTLDLNKSVVSMQRMLHRLIGEDIRLQCTTDPTLHHVTVDPGQLEQVLLNLSVNSRDAMPRGGTLTIATGNVTLDQDTAVMHGLSAAGEFVTLSVTDTGEGIPPQVLPHIFEPFFTTKPQGVGTGLGLSTVYGVVKQSGGNILVNSEAGLGTTFTLYFPATPDDGSPSAQPAAVEPMRGSATVLVVEDEHSVRKFIVEVLSRAGYRVIQAADAEEALKLSRATDEPIDLLLTDVIMPGMSGGQLSLTLLAERPTTKVLFMSGYAAESARNIVLASTAEFIGKPFSGPELLFRVNAVLQGPTAP